MLLALLFALPACKGCGTTHFDQVPLTGLLSCPPTPQQRSRWLVHPVVVDLTTRGTHVRHVFEGWSGQTRARTLSLPDGNRSYTARFGQCTRSPGVRWHCTRLKWYATRTVEVDPTARGASILVPAPPSSDCGDAAARDR